MSSQMPKAKYDAQDWLQVFEAAFQEDPKLAEKAARLWQGLLNEIEAGPDGLRNARESLQTAIRFAFQYFPIYRRFQALP